MPNQFSLAGLSCKSPLVFIALCLTLAMSPVRATDYNTNFTWRDGVSNTRHNLSMAGGTNPSGFIMNGRRNDYGEVCVYCHTPHGANTQAAVASAPLWNRTYSAATYTTYSSATLTGSVSGPGVASLVCLSCHDGTVAVDSIINMPGSGRYSAASATSHQESFLDAWGGSSTHLAIGNSSPAHAQGCMSCHNAETPLSNGTDFTAFYIGTDLRNDHPVGVVYPNNPEYNQGGLVNCGICSNGTNPFQSNSSVQPGNGSVWVLPFRTGSLPAVE